MLWPLGEWGEWLLHVFAVRIGVAIKDHTDDTDSQAPDHRLHTHPQVGPIKLDRFRLTAPAGSD